jgi:hypothetical protein
MYTHQESEIYRLKCMDYPEEYVGKTGWAFGMRCNKHGKGIKFGSRSSTHTADLRKHIPLED